MGKRQPWLHYPETDRLRIKIVRTEIQGTQGLAVSGGGRKVRAGHMQMTRKEGAIACF